MTIDLQQAVATHPDFDGHFRVVNIGDTPAKIVRSHVMIDWRSGQLPMNRPYDGVIQNNRIQGELAPGASLVIQFSDSDISPSDSLTRGDSIAILGYIDYEDTLGARRETAFCRTYDRATERFVISKNEDYEHEE